MWTFSRLYEILKINGRIYNKVRGKTALFFIDDSKQQEKWGAGYRAKLR